MTNTLFTCQVPSHVGGRYVQHPSDRYQLRLEMRRADGNGRPHARAIENMCRTCMEEVVWQGIEVSPVGVMAAAIRLVCGKYFQPFTQQMVIPTESEGGA